MLTPRFLILDDSQAPPWFAETLAGLDLPLLRLRPGLDHPPPGAGDGLRERVIRPGVPVAKSKAQRLATVIGSFFLCDNRRATAQVS